MTEINGQKDEFTLVDRISKSLAVSVGLLYLAGFLVVTSYLSRYGVSSFSVLQLQYLVVGVWVLGPPVALISLRHAEYKFEERATQYFPGIFNWRRFAITTLLTGVPFGVWFGVVAGVPGFYEDMTWRAGLYWWVFLLGLQACFYLVLTSWRIPKDKENWFVNRHAVPFHLSLLASVLIVYVLWFSIQIYPLIPFSLGGGRPLNVVFISSEKQLPQGIVKDGASGRSIPYRLLMVTDKSYVVLSPIQNEESIEFGRESVQGMIVLRETHTH